ncbi:energy-coupling factor transporter ATPase [Hominifimenecus sp. rT4P-3]|uniref:energy-coupling factor transporter ATPase n=1 Tax=Hominifimenecus sp. rT4P-3 TaxID=3242979 RepID=UPI003DA487BB
MGMIKTDRLVFEYIRKDEENQIEEVMRAVDGVSLDIEKGQFVAILGRNGSGKSTLAKHMNALLFPTDGVIWVGDKDTREEENLWEVRQSAGMVFQNPDNQIIATVVEEDVGFGPENIGVPSAEIWKRVQESLEAVGMTAYRKASPNHLSGGQKQRVAIAGVMAMRPQCIVLDEPTAMLDPNGRQEVIRTVRELNQAEGITVILITHYMEETVFSDRIFVMDRGKIQMAGTPREIFSQVEELKALHLDVPQVTELGAALAASGLPLSSGILTISELVQALVEARESGACIQSVNQMMEKQEEPEPEAGESILELRDVTYRYGRGTPMEVKVLKEISFAIPKGQFLSIIGHTGSGKSTLIQHLNGLLKPDSGEVLFHGESIYREGYDKRILRGKVGLVFQYPEHQLFEETVFADVCFGPKNQGLPKEQIEARAKEALRLVGMDESFYTRSPFELSGGQKRRAAIAGVLAMEPEVLVLDEPTAGLDPGGRDEILDQIKKLHEEKGMAVVLVSHSMEDVARYAERLLVLEDGRIAYDGTPREVFRHYRELETMGLSAPQVTYLAEELRKNGFSLPGDITTVEEAKQAIENAFAGIDGGRETQPVRN